MRDERHGGERGVLEIGGVFPPRQRAHAIATKRRRRFVPQKPRRAVERRRRRRRRPKHVARVPRVRARGRIASRRAPRAGGVLKRGVEFGGDVPMKKRIERTPRGGRERVRARVVQTPRRGVRGDVAKHGVDLRLFGRERRGEEFAQFGVRPRRRREKMRDFASQAIAERRRGQPLAIPRQRRQRSSRAARALQRPRGHLFRVLVRLEGNGPKRRRRERVVERVVRARVGDVQCRSRRLFLRRRRLRRAFSRVDAAPRRFGSIYTLHRVGTRIAVAVVRSRAETGRASQFENSEGDAVRLRRRRQRHLRRREVGVATEARAEPRARVHRRRATHLVAVSNPETRANLVRPRERPRRVFRQSRHARRDGVLAKKRGASTRRARRFKSRSRRRSFFLIFVFLRLGALRHRRGVEQDGDETV